MFSSWLWLKILDWPLNGNKVFSFLSCILWENFQFLRHLSSEMNKKVPLRYSQDFLSQFYLHYHLYRCNMNIFS